MGAFRQLWRLARQTFHEAMGAMFLVFAAVGAIAAVRQWHNPAGHWIAWLGAAYAVMMGGFGLSAFRDSRRVR